MTEFYNLSSNLLVPAPGMFDPNSETHIHYVADLPGAVPEATREQVVQSHNVRVFLVNAETAAEIPAALEKDKQNMLKVIKEDPAQKDNLGGQVAFIEGLQDMLDQKIFKKDPGARIFNTVKSKLGENYDAGQLVMLSGISGFSKSTP